MQWIDVNNALPPIDEEVIVLTNRHQLGALTESLDGWTAVKKYSNGQNLRRIKRL